MSFVSTSESGNSTMSRMSATRSISPSSSTASRMSTASSSRYMSYRKDVLWGREASIEELMDPIEHSVSGASPVIERLRLASRSVSPAKSLPSGSRQIRIPLSLSNKTFSHRRAKSHPTLNIPPGFVAISHPKSAAYRAGVRSDPGVQASTPSAIYTTPVLRRGSFVLASPFVLQTPRTAMPGTPTVQNVSRMVLVNPKVASHLKQGGVVNVKSRDGSKRWRVYLPANASTPVVSRSL